MKLCFTIDALAASGDDAWRLLEDGVDWRACIFAEDAKEGDAKLTNPRDVAAWPGRRLRKDKDHVLAPASRPGMFDFFMRGVFSHAIPHRFTPAPIPDKAQMRKVIAEATPGAPWLPYVDLAGHFRLLDTSRGKIIGNTDIAVRGEIASSSEYIGQRAAANKILMDESYRQFLAGWLQHLNTRRLAVFVPDAEKLEPEDKLIAQIHGWQYE
ncbi:MAG: hypothetical protein R8K46_03560 [Mariprofundaceae bacterium]